MIMRRPEDLKCLFKFDEVQRMGTCTQRSLGECHVVQITMTYAFRLASREMVWNILHKEKL